jgi:hypothetical protein
MEMKTLLTTIVLSIFAAHYTSAQLEKVIIEKYYVSDTNDATDNLGGGIPEGSATYRIYVDLKPGTILKRVYGDADHPFSISSSEVFFNNAIDGQSFAKDFIRGRYLENTVALDTWLTLGQTARQGTKYYYGILKNQDTDGSFVGGVNNDGGSAMISSGLLINEDPTCGFPLTLADGMDTLNSAPSNWQSNGVLDFFSGTDSTMFGSIVPQMGFESNNFQLSCSGVSGTVLDSNQVIIAQLTTLGELAFNINITVEELVNGVPTLVNYVSQDTLLGANEKYNPFLSYPYSCGCNNPNYLEYNSSFVCLEEGSCITPIVFGCMDSLACNYDPAVNISVEALCCYPGSCAGRNIEEVCPSLMGNEFDIMVYPNPTESNISLNIISGIDGTWNYEIYSSYGANMKSGSITTSDLNIIVPIETSELVPGIYQMKVSNGVMSKHKLFIKI